MELYNLKLRLNERKRDYHNNNTLAESDLDTTNRYQKEQNDCQRSIVRIKLVILNEEELIFKRKLNKLTGDGATRNDEFILKESQLTQLLNASNLNELNLDEIWNIKFEEETDDDLVLINYEDEPILNEHRFIIDDEDDENFHDTYDDPVVLLTEVAKEKMAKKAEIDSLKRKMLEIGSKKSALRLSLNKINESEKLAGKEILKQAEAEHAENPDTDLGSKDRTFTVKSASERKQEDAIQREMFIENRKKALQRLREYKQKYNAKKKSANGLSESLKTTAKATTAVTTTTTTTLKAVKKPYLTKRISHQSKSLTKPRTNKTNASKTAAQATRPQGTGMYTEIRVCLFFLA